MEIVAQVVDPVVKFLMVTITKHVGFFVCSTKNVKAMDAKKKQLNKTAQNMQNKKERADANHKVVSDHVSPWLEEVKKLNEDAENIPPSGIGCFNVAKRYKAGKQSFDILEKIKDLEERSKIEWTNELIPLGMVVSSTSETINHDGTPARFESRELIVKDALKFLGSNDETKKMMALCGMGGVGKTTMMEQLRKVVENSRMFDWVVKVVIGENTDPIAFQKAIAEKMGEALTETTKDARAERLCRKFAGMSQNGEKKILVIMDDLWKEIDLEDVGLKSPLPKGLKFLFTSRFEDVCSRMGVKTDSIFKVGILKDAEAKGLFFGIMDPSISNGDNPELQKIGEDIVNKCRGLPIAIVTIAKSLKDDIKDAWEAVRSRLQGDDLEDLDSIVKTIFKMSYDNLKKDIDKSMFLLSGLFPEDFDIPTEELLRYGWGLGFFKNAKTLATARRDMKICVNNLLRANLLIESDEEGCVKMHDLVRAFALSNFSKVKQASIANHDSMSMRVTEDANESYERILLNCKGMSEFPTGFNYPDLSVLLLINGNDHLKFPQDFYERMEKLEVLSYEGIRTPLLPVTFENATKLRTLCLRSCVLMYDFSFLGNLINLETLSFAKCGVRKLPSTIGKLKRLKLLDLTGCVSLRIDDGVFENLVSLEELYMRSSDGCPIKFTDANCKELGKLSTRLHALQLEFFQNAAQPRDVSFEKLERFRISIGCEFEYSDYFDSAKFSFKNTLNLVSNCNELLECKISGLFDKTEELHLQVNDMNSIEDVSMNHSFSNLTVLNVHYCAELTYLFTIPVANGLKKLTHLTVRKCPVLKALVGGDDSGVEVIKFPELEFMSLDDLPKLISLWDTSFNVIELPKVVELELSDLPSFTSIFPDSSNTQAMQCVLNKEVVIPNLEQLYIIDMVNLEQIWPCQMTTAEKNNVSMVKYITVRGCDNLVNLFPSNPLPLLNHLENVVVRECRSVEVLFNLELEHVCEMEGYISRLRYIRIVRLGKLRELWRMKGVDNSDILINGFKGVELIWIENCYEFKYIFTPTTANFDLGALTSFSTWNVDSQESIIVSEGMANLTSQLLHTCHHLQNLQLQADKKVEVVFDMDSPSSSTQLSTNQQPPLLLPNLEVLKLYKLENMSHVWKCNWNKFLIPQQPPFKLPFHNLTEIYLDRCDKIKYLLSPLMAKFLSNLKHVKINSCSTIEEVISSRDDEKATSTFTSSHTNVRLFPHLETLELGYLDCLKRIDGGDASSRSDKISFNTTTSIDDEFQSTQVNGAFWSLCQYPRKILITNCSELSSLIPRYAVGQLKNLEELKISYCRTLIEIFESQTVNNNTELDDEGSAIGSNTLASPRLKGVTVVPQLSNLKDVSISYCHLLHVFTFSTLESLKKLKTLKVECCWTTQVIVKEELGEQMTPPKVVKFPRLETLELVNLSNLEGFFLGKNHEFRWPLLDRVKISGCPKMIGFTSGPSETPKLKYVWTELGKHSLTCGLNFQGTINQTAFPSLNPTISEGIPTWSFHNLIELNPIMHISKMMIPTNALLQVQKLEKIILDELYMVEEVFEVEALEMKTINDSGFTESQTVVEISNLREVELKELGRLKYLWKRNQRMVIEFPKLTRVSISRCESLEHVFTCSMVGSLVDLQDLHIECCKKITEIVKEEEEEVCDAKVNDIIILPRLKSVTLTDLESLKGFCLGKEAFSWPSLNTLEIKNCPAITVFTKGHLDTLELKVIETSFGMCGVSEDVNSFIKSKQEEGYQF